MSKNNDPQLLKGEFFIKPDGYHLYFRYSDDFQKGERVKNVCDLTEKIIKEITEGENK